MTGQRKPAIAVIGTGLMGRPMAMRLLAAGYTLTVWNRTIQKTQELAMTGARVVTTPAEAATNADIIITMLADGPAVTQVIFERMVGAIAADAVVVDMSSIPPALAREHAARLASLGIHHLDAPVSGGTIGASEGTLAIMAGGDSTVFARARPVLEVLGRPTLVGPSGSGQVSKLANQTIVAVTIGAVAEALLIAAAGGADPVKVREALAGGFADSAILRQHGQRMLDRAWMPGATISVQVKDLRTIISLSGELGLRLPLTTRTAALFESALGAGLGNYDHSALFLEIERLNSGTSTSDRVEQGGDLATDPEM